MELKTNWKWKVTRRRWEECLQHFRAWHVLRAKAHSQPSRLQSGVPASTPSLEGLPCGRGQAGSQCRVTQREAATSPLNGGEGGAGSRGSPCPGGHAQPPSPTNVARGRHLPGTSLCCHGHPSFLGRGTSPLGATVASYGEKHPVEFTATESDDPGDKHRCTWNGTSLHMQPAGLLGSAWTPFLSPHTHSGLRFRLRPVPPRLGLKKAAASLPHPAPHSWPQCRLRCAASKDPPHPCSLKTGLQSAWVRESPPSFKVWFLTATGT